jgi:hypothetical protein
MTPDEMRERLRTDTPRWDDVRERRALATILGARRAGRRWARHRRSIATFAAGAVVLAVALWIPAPGRRRPTRSEDVSAARPSAMANVPMKPASGLSSLSASRVTLPDGSLAVLSEGAEIALERSPDAGARVVVRQSGGRVRYEVRHDPAHPFLVRASTVTVRVLGTVFTVAFRDGRVAVSVDEGRVEVFDGRRRVSLGPGDELVVSHVDETAHSRSRRSAAEQESHRPAREPPPRPADGSTADAWMARADDARQAGNLAAAAEALRMFVDGHPEDTRVPAALFTVGTVERTAGHPDAAAAAFARYRRQAPDGPLAEDALAAEAAAWLAANDRTRAQTVAGEYLARYPRGAHLVSMREILR